MTMPEEEDEIRIPAEVPPPVAEVEEESEGDVDDLFEVPQLEDNDMRTDHLIDIDDPEDLSDLTAVTQEDVMGTPPKQKPKYRLVRRPIRRYPPPPTTVRGIK